MRKLYKLLMLLLIILAGCVFSISQFYVDAIDGDENTLIISQCTGQMRALETGVSVYAGYKGMPLILSDKQIPSQIDSWLPDYIRKHNITKVIVVGQMDAGQIIKLKMMNVDVKQVYGESISQILTKLADNSHDKNNDTVIFTASDPLAGFLGAYMKAPVFVTASNSSYESSNHLDDNYVNYLKSHDIKKIIIIGNLPESLVNELNEYNATVEVLSGQSSAEVSTAVNDKLKGLGYINSTTAYYGFYGELPAVIPTAVKEKAYLMEDSSFDPITLNYLKDNDVQNIYLTRNVESDYIQMEETDYISSDVVESLMDNDFDVSFLTKDRTLDEATGLYDMKMMVLDDSIDRKPDNDNNFNIRKSKPPLLEMLDYRKWIDSNNISVEVKTNNNSSYTVKWNTIHPYTWIKYDDAHYYATSNTGYEYYWTYDNNTWNVDYKYNNTRYYNVTWMENDDNTWTEIQRNKNYTWSYDGSKWYCYNQEENLTYTLSLLE
ncbi:MAG: hypothetical protein Q4Q22_03970 [Methanosphaera sp.]|nr:hypothetical protein [Methanosphaera sp.]